MNIETIKQLARNKGLTISDLAIKINKTESGLHAMFRNNSMKISTLEKISEVLGVPITKFFQDFELTDDKGNKMIFEAKEPGAEYRSALSNCQKEVETWKQKAYDCMEKYNALLEQQIQQRNRQTG